MEFKNNQITDRSDTVYLVGLSEKCRGGQRPKPGSETYLEKDGRQKLQGMNTQKQEIKKENDVT